MSFITQVKKLAKKHDIEIVERPNGHVQLKGDFLVNYYPGSSKKTAYVAGTTKGKKHCTPEQAIRMAIKPPPVTKEKDRRKGNTRRKRFALLNKGVTSCHWCGKPLDIDNSTLEHIIPLHRGGLDNANNRTLACEPCNNSRGHNMPEVKANE